MLSLIDLSFLGERIDFDPLSSSFETLSTPQVLTIFVWLILYYVWLVLSMILMINLYANLETRAAPAAPHQPRRAARTAPPASNQPRRTSCVAPHRTACTSRTHRLHQPRQHPHPRTWTLGCRRRIRTGFQCAAACTHQMVRQAASRSRLAIAPRLG